MGGTSFSFLCLSGTAFGRAALGTGPNPGASALVDRPGSGCGESRSGRAGPPSACPTVVRRDADYKPDIACARAASYATGSYLFGESCFVVLK